MTLSVTPVNLRTCKTTLVVTPRITRVQKLNVQLEMAIDNCFISFLQLYTILIKILFNSYKDSIPIKIILFRQNYKDCIHYLIMYLLSTLLEATIYFFVLYIIQN